MKRIATLIILFATLLLLCITTQCKKDPYTNGLPRETRTGANTFGCYVNGELFIPARGTAPGTYFLHVEGAGELVREQIIVTR
ncbi:MAG: hypothetical protein FWE63_08220 [Bacteroidales bacterium]|nr:hypothetical protein [Bacteroidales bacterium]